MDEPVDTSDIPEMDPAAPRVRRTAAGRLPKGRESPTRTAILAELERRRMTRYQLWNRARALCPKLPRSAVYEFLRGQREIGLHYAEAIMKAVGLVVRPKRVTRSKPVFSPKRPPKAKVW